MFNKVTSFSDLKRFSDSVSDPRPTAPMDVNLMGLWMLQ